MQEKMSFIACFVSTSRNETIFTLTRVEEFLKQFTTKNRKTKDENGYSKLRWVKICNLNEAFDIILLAYSGVKMTNLVLNGKR